MAYTRYYQQKIPELLRPLPVVGSTAHKEADITQSQKRSSASYRTEEKREVDSAFRTKQKRRSCRMIVPSRLEAPIIQFQS